MTGWAAGMSRRKLLKSSINHHGSTGTHPAIFLTSVVGVPDKRMGEEICAWISVKENMTLTEEDVKQFCKGKISHFKIPRYIMFVKEFPKTLTGKIKKSEMTRMSIEELKL
ncbi:medium-chain acyl-CoA ligase ACSF2, mitochondrial [Caerostris extrusa]|uniref:Medium-chain acyl-CoA ligase ACSF2, mitochondrial n=1 Tax=Caerostris extrusa TaxID=172846 RepID=A0AAV4MSP3_CAEEX|nr:medium-chain acyl-CoA ligase ACSF2, mitochondrial [Caerostris extrusa]